MKTKTTFELTVYNLSRLITGGGLIGGSLVMILLGEGNGSLLPLLCLNMILGMFIAYLGIKSAKIHKYEKKTPPKSN